MCWNLAVEFVLLITISLTLCFSSEARNVKSLLHDDSSKSKSKSSRFISGETVSVECNKDATAGLKQPAVCTNPSKKLCSQSLERPQVLFPPIVPPVLPSPPPTFGGVPLPPNPFQPPPLLPNPLQPPSPPAFGLPLIPGLIPSPPPPPPLLPLPPGLPVPLPPVIPGVPPANKHKVTP